MVHNNRKLIKTSMVALLVILSIGLAPELQAQETAVIGTLVAGVSGGATEALTGYALTALGLNSQSAYQTDVENQLFEINQELQTISANWRISNPRSRRKPA